MIRLFVRRHHGIIHDAAAGANLCAFAAARALFRIDPCKAVFNRDRAVFAGLYAALAGNARLHASGTRYAAGIAVPAKHDNLRVCRCNADDIARALVNAVAASHTLVFIDLCNAVFHADRTKRTHARTVAQADAGKAALFWAARHTRRGCAALVAIVFIALGCNAVVTLADHAGNHLFALLNRKAMLSEIVLGLGLTVRETISTIHNYIDTDAMILRKGAVSAKAGEQLLIPINMRDGSLICVGKGNEDWNCSAPHGAGRLMSRADAKQSFTVSEFKKQMADVFTTSVNKSTLDECPMAYKGMQDILDNIGPTADVVKVIRPIYNFKAGDEE